MMIYGNIGPAATTLNHDPAGRLMEGARPGGAVRSPERTGLWAKIPCSAGICREFLQSAA
jgi:hypothetical protein